MSALCGFSAQQGIRMQNCSFETIKLKEFPSKENLICGLTGLPNIS